MPLKFLHRLVIALTSLAFVASATLQIAPPVMALSVAQAPQTSVPIHDCPDMVGGKPAAPVPMDMPCQRMTPECLKAMGCVGFLVLPQYSAQVASPVRYGRVAFSSRREVYKDLGVEPLPLPPRPA